MSIFANIKNEHVFLPVSCLW